MGIATIFAGALAAGLVAPAPPPAGDEEIVVTGSRLPGGGAAAPVTSVPAEALLKAAPASLPDALNRLPQFQLSSSPSRSTHNFASSASNGNILNLRGVGGIRTLILFDGLRVPPTTYRGEVDVNVLPELLVQRVEIVTAGASAAYGSDAVSGVVNFVLDRTFTGLRGVAQAGAAQRGDNGTYRLGVAGGWELGGGDGHVLLSAERFETRGMLRSDRKAGRRNYVFAGSTGAGTPGSAANPFAIYAGTRSTAASDFGKIVGPDGSPFLNFRFGADGTLARFDNGAPTGTPGFSVGGDGFIIPADTTAVAPSRTQQLFGRVEHRLSPAVTAFAQASVSRSDLSYSSLANSFVAPTAAQLFKGNPYLPAAIDGSLAPGEALTIARYGGTEPKPHTAERTDFWMASGGADASLGGSWNARLSLTHGHSRHDVAQDTVWDWQRTYAALDAVRDSSGAIVCRATLDPDPAIRSRFAACQPLNILVSGAAFTGQPGYAYAAGTSRYRAAIAQDTATASISGSPFQLPAGPAAVVIGAEYRRQSLRLTSNADPSLLDTPAERAAYFAGLRGVSPAALAYWLTDVGAADGRVRVSEAFGEVRLPVLASLQLNGAARLTDYSSSGTVTTWRAGARWEPAAGVAFRASLSRDIRAPSLFELFAGPQSGIGLLVDPRSGRTGNVPSISGGNPDLKPERARTLGAGATLSPAFLPELTLALDYYRLRIRGQIGTLSISQIAQNCFADSAAPECGLVTQPDPSQLPTAIRVVPANIALLRTSGIDIDAAYRMGAVSLRVVVSYLDAFKTRQSASAPLLDFAGYGQTANQPVGRPRWQGVMSVGYDSGGFGVFVSERVIGGLRIGSQEPNQDYGGRRIGAVFYSDLTLSRRLAGESELFLTVNNLFDRQPPLVPGTIPGLNLPTIISLYDTVGRAMTAGVRLRF